MIQGMFQLKRAVPLAAALVLLASGAADAAPPPKRAASTRPAPAGLNAIVRLELPNGLRILVLPDSATPMISAGLWIGAGWVHNPRGREGLADLCAATDVRRVRDAVFARQAGKPYLAEALSSKVSADQTVFGVNALAEDLDPALEVLRAAVPAAEEAFAGAPSIKRDALLNLMQSRFDPGLVVREAFAVALFGDRRPLGFSARFQSLVGLMADDVRRFHRDYYLPGNAVLTVAGAARPEAVRAAAARVFGGWAAGTPGVPAWGHAAASPAHPGVTLVDAPDAPFAVIVGGLAGPGREDPAFTAVQLLHQVIGGSRIESGLASFAASHPQGYQFRSQLRSSARGSELTVEAVVPHELVAGALTELKRALADLGKSGIDSTAFAAEVKARAISLAFRYENPGERMREAVALLLAGQPLAAAERPAAAGAAVDRTAASALWHSLLEPDHVVWTIAGRADELAPKLGAAGVTPARGDLFEVATGRLFTAPADSTILLPGPAATVQAEELMFTAIEAKGGFAALERVGSYSVEDSIWVQPGGDIVPGTRKVFLRFPDRYREELAIAALQGRGVIQVVDGKDVWRDQLGRVKTASETRRQDLLGRLWMDGLRVFHRYGEPGAQAFIVDPEVIGDVTLDGFQISSPDGYWVRLYLHPQSRLVVKRTASQPTDQGVLQTEELFTDYRPVEGVFVPFIAATYLDGKWSTEIHTLSIDFNPELPEDLFERKQF